MSPLSSIYFYLYKHVRKTQKCFVVGKSKWQQLVFMRIRGAIASAPPDLVLPVTECECDNVYTLYTQ